MRIATLSGGEGSVAEVRIVADSASDLPTKLAEELGITIVPMNVHFGDQSLSETELTHDQFWMLAHAREHPQTSQPAPGVYIETFRRLVEQGYQVICTTITGKHSGTFGTAWGAAHAFGDCVHVVDSLSLSIGEGWQVIQAARLARQGLSAERVIEAIQSIRRRTHVLIQLETLEFIRRGGRAARLMPAIDRLVKVLSLRPILNIVEGELKLMGAARSTQKGLKRMQEELLSLGKLEFLGVMHIRAQELAEQLADDLARLLGVAREAIWVDEAGAVLACHAGQGAVGVIGVVAE